MRQAHENLCDYADDLQALYKLWNDDLRRCIKRREWSFSVGLMLVAAALLSLQINQTIAAAVCAYFAVIFLYLSVKYLIDESNTNYLLHSWDLRVWLYEFRQREKREIATLNRTWSP